MLAPRRRKAVNYNESKLHRKYASASESERTAAQAGSDADSSDDENGAETKVGAHACCTDVCGTARYQQDVILDTRPN